MTPSHGFRGKRHAPAGQDQLSPASSDLASNRRPDPSNQLAPSTSFARVSEYSAIGRGWALGRTASRIASVFDGCLQRGYDTLSNGDNS